MMGSLEAAALRFGALEEALAGGGDGGAMMRPRDGARSLSAKGLGGRPVASGM